MGGVICLWVYMYSEYVEARGRLCGGHSSHLYIGSKVELGSLGLYSQCPYPPSHLASARYLLKSVCVYVPGSVCVCVCVLPQMQL